MIDHAESVFRRLANALRVVDGMFATNQVPTNNHTLDEQTDAFDHLVLLVAAIHDDLAHLVDVYFALPEMDKRDVGLRENAFRRALRATGDPRSDRLERRLARSGSGLWVHVEIAESPLVHDDHGVEQIGEVIDAVRGDEHRHVARVPRGSDRDQAR